ncbi:hypothetical protein BH11PSE7_BH11PSE7_38200 [soil metagenome]
MNASLLLWGVLFGAIGSGYMLYGKKQKAPVPLLCGLALVVAPYFIVNTLLLIAMGVALPALPFLYRP